MSSQGPTTKSEFVEAMDKLIMLALNNGVSIANGGYELRHDADTPDIELMVYQLDKPDDDHK